MGEGGGLAASLSKQRGEKGDGVEVPHGTWRGEGGPPGGRGGGDSDTARDHVGLVAAAGPAWGG
jgi:hypothetical protein